MIGLELREFEFRNGRKRGFCGLQERPDCVFEFVDDFFMAVNLFKKLKVYFLGHFEVLLDFAQFNQSGPVVLLLQKHLSWLIALPLKLLEEVLLVFKE